MSCLGWVLQKQSLGQGLMCTNLLSSSFIQKELSGEIVKERRKQDRGEGATGGGDFRQSPKVSLML